MGDFTEVLAAIERGDPLPADQLLPLVYDELRKLAAARLAHEAPGQTLQPTALVHEAYVRLAGAKKWDGRGHFFSAAAEAMRRILVERARGKRSLKQGGGRRRLDLLAADAVVEPADVELLALDESLEKLRSVLPDAAELVKLRFFGGLSLEEAAETLEISERTARRRWVYARAWLRREMSASGDAQQR